tara:strand:+ start:95 stop:325 length:231 start_codon:yes stop_codon:yes gene_type:complete
MTDEKDREIEFLRSIVQFAMDDLNPEGKHSSHYLYFEDLFDLLKEALKGNVWNGKTGYIPFTEVEGDFPKSLWSDE